MVSTALRATLIAVLVAAVPPGAQLAARDNLAPSIDRLVLFGDSLSDPGNTYIETGEFEVRPFDEVPGSNDLRDAFQALLVDSTARPDDGQGREARSKAAPRV